MKLFYKEMKIPSQLNIFVFAIMIITAELKLFRKYFLIIVCCDSVKTPSMNNWPRTIAAQEILPRTIAPPGLLPSPQINAPE